MRIKVGNKWYDGKKEPIMVELAEKDKRNIANMNKDCTKYCEFPDGIDFSKQSDKVKVKEFMEEQTGIVIENTDDKDKLIERNKKSENHTKILLVCTSECIEHCPFCTKEIKPGEKYYFIETNKIVMCTVCEKCTNAKMKGKPIIIKKKGEPAMKFKAYEEIKEKEETVYFRLKNSGYGDVVLEAVDVNGKPKGSILAISSDGRLGRYFNINKTLGLKLDEEGKISTKIV